MARLGYTVNGCVLLLPYQPNVSGLVTNVGSCVRLNLGQYVMYVVSHAGTGVLPSPHRSGHPDRFFYMLN